MPNHPNDTVLFKSGDTLGTVAWFKQDQKFRFLNTAEGDIFVPPALVAKHADELVLGARVKVSYQTGERGLVATDIKWVKEPLQEPSYVGEVKFYNQEKNFGFIGKIDGMPDGAEVFLHASVCNRAGVIPWAGLKLEFTAEDGRGGRLQATSISAAPAEEGANVSEDAPASTDIPPVAKAVKRKSKVSDTPVATAMTADGDQVGASAEA